jgi:ABC-type nitrate/sulfonate/bicarbonate transport system substrate-binding protein
MTIQFLFLAFVTAALAPGRVGAAQPTKIRISYSSRSNAMTPFYFAVQNGFFTEEGMDAELIQINPRLGATAVLNGDVDFTTTFGSTLRAIVGGFPLKFVAASVRKTDHFLVVRPELKELKDLKDKRLAVSTLFGTDQRAAEEMLRSKGFPAGFFKAIALGDAPVRAQALRSGVVEGRRSRRPSISFLRTKAIASSQARTMSSSLFRVPGWPSRTGCCSRTRRV